jgi:NAD(P)-dependent dehydrogenase (short-subunit alcohol dehydrogenase family)
MSDLANQTVAVVGGSSGIGLATARAAAAEGAHVVLASRRRDRLEEAAGTIPGTARAVTLDMLDRASVRDAISSVGEIDHLVLAAAGEELAWRGRITDLTAEQVERTLDKLRGYVNVAREAAPRIRRGGSITLLSGTSAVRPPEGFSVLGAVNAAVAAFGRGLAIDLAPLRVNVVMPDVVDTPRHAGNRQMLEARARSSPARHLGTPDDIAAAIVFLMTNPYMTGHTLVIDGGLVTA